MKNVTIPVRIAVLGIVVGLVEHVSDNADTLRYHWRKKNQYSRRVRLATDLSTRTIEMGERLRCRQLELDHELELWRVRDRCTPDDIAQYYQETPE